MALKFRGLSQIRDASIELSKIKDISSGVILGRPEEQSANYDANAASPSELSGEDVRRIAGLHSDDNVHFANIESDAITATSADLGAGALIAGTATLSGDMNASGAVTGASSDMVGLAKSGSLESGAATLASANIAGTLEAGASTLASATVNGTLVAGASTLSSATITNAASIGSTLDVTGKITGSDEAEFSGALSAGNSTFSSITVGGNITATGTLHADGALTAASADFGAGSLDAGATTLASATVNGVVLADSFSSSSVNIDGGSIDNTSIGSTTPESGAFTDVSATGDLTVDGNLTVSGDMVYVNTINLQVKDPIMHMGEGNAADIQDLGFFASYKSETGVENAVSNSSFDSDLSGWDVLNVSSGDSISWSSSYGGSAEFVSANMNTFNNMARIEHEFMMPSSAPSGVYTVKVKIDGYNTNSDRVLLIGLTGSYQTSAVLSGFNSVSEMHSYFGGGDFELNWTYDAAASSAYAKKILIQYGVQQWASAYNLPPETLYVKEVKLYNQNGQEVTISNGLELKHAGMVRDADDAKFKLFSTSEDLSSKTVVDFGSASKSILVANIEGDIAYDNAVTFSVSGDVAGSVSFSGNNSPEIVTTIQDNSVQLSNIDFFIDENDMASDSAIHVPSQASVKAYAASQISSGGLSGISAQDIQMVDSSGSFIAVHKEFQYTTVSADNESSRTINMDNSIESEFKDLSMVYLNGKKLRYSSDSGTSNDYWFTEASAGPSKYSNDLTASDAASKDFFGSGVGLSSDGTVLSVGASRWEGSSTDQGGVYIYDWNSSNEEWGQRGDVITAPDAEGSDRFGESTSLNSDGTIMATGAMLWDGNASNQGAAYVFEYNDTASFNDPTKYSNDLTASDQAASDQYGRISISQDGNVMAVGAFSWDRADNGSNHGGVYIYDWNSSTDSWDQRGDVFSPASDATDNIRFGTSTSLSSDGTYLAVGALLYSDTATWQGGAYVYKWNSSTNSWDKQGSTVVAGDAGASDYHANVAINSDGTILSVGANLWDGASGENHGAVYTYDWSNTDWVQRGSALSASDAGAADQFGRNVSLSANGEILFVGSPYWEGANTNQGGVYIYDWNSSTSAWDQRGSVLESNSPVSNGNFGFAVETNGDGTVLSVTEYYGGVASNNIQIFDWNSSTSSWDYRTSISDMPSGTVNFGYSLSLSSDATKLAISDVGNGSTVAGKVFTYSITENSVGWSQKGSTIYQDSASSYDLHTHVSISGNGLVLSVGVYAYDGSLTDQGATYIYDWNSSTSDWDQRGPVLLPSDAAAYDYFGRDTSLSNDGSVLVIGSAEWEGDTSNQGGVYIYDWNSSTSSWDQRGDVLESNSPSANDYFGFSAQISSDATTMAVTKYQYASGGGDIGEVEIFDWNSSTSTWDYRLSIENPYGASSGTKNSTSFGYKVSLDGDGDVLVISEKGTGYDNFAGRVQTYSLPPAGSNVAKLNFKQDIISENDKVETILIVKS